MGFRGLTSFNKALLANQTWKLIHAEDYFFSMYFKNMYFSLSKFLSSTLKKNFSEVWRSLKWAMDIVRARQGWRISDGSQVDIWEDNWLVGHNYFKSFFSPP